jgi:hypothetical protein
VTGLFTPARRSGVGGRKKYLGSDILMPDQVGRGRGAVSNAGPVSASGTRSGAGGRKKYLGSDILMSGEVGGAEES